MSALASRLARARFRAWHRGTREADYMIGGFFDRYHSQWSEADLMWFEALLEEDDVEIMAWALGSVEAPENYAGPLMRALQKLDYVTI
jgi:antitoxin CptB